MTEREHETDSGRGAGDLPEPPLDELYELYVRSLTSHRKRWMADCADDPALEEALAQKTQPQSKDRFRAYLDECAARGARHWFVNRLVLGVEYCDSHPDDPRIRMPLGQEQFAREEDKRLSDGLYSTLVEGLRDRDGGRGGR